MLLVILAAILSIPAALAQGTGAIHGSVLDPTGAPVEGASVTALLVDRNLARAARTGPRGDYVLPSLPVGRYRVSVEHAGFKQLRQDDIELTANDNVRVDARLELGAVSESVEVVAAQQGIDTRSSTIGTLIDSRRVTEIPINGRNVVALAAMLPGVANVESPQAFTNTNQGPTANISGSRVNANLFLFDGAPFNATFRNRGLNFPPPDALQEVKILTNSFGAEYGRNSGSVFNVVTRSGTNRFHGTLWEFLRNNNLNARNFFSPTSAPQLVQNQFGASAGGPVKRNSLFFFAAWEGLRVRSADLITGAFPITAEERAGAFTRNVRDPANNQMFPNRAIPVSRMDATARRLADPAVMPLPNEPGGRYATTAPNPVDNNNLLTRLDHNRGRHLFDLRYNRSATKEGNVFAGQIPSYMTLLRDNYLHSVTVGDTFTIGPNLLNQLRVSFLRVDSTIANKNPKPLASYGSAFPVIGRPIPPHLAITGRVTMGQNASTDTTVVNQSLDISESLSWTRGAHTLKTGFEFLRPRYVNRGHFLTMGSFSFTGTATGDAAADFLLGRAEQLQVGSPALEQTGDSFAYYGFAQDDWRVHRRLTLNLGLRYELPLPWVHPNDWWGTLRVGRRSTVIPNAPIGMLFPGDAGVPRGLIQTDKNNFAPRFGFAWDVAGNGRTAVRGSYGVFYETLNADLMQNTSQPYRYSFTYQALPSLVDPLAGQPPIPLGVNLAAPLFVGLQELNYPDAAMRSPYVHHASFNVQRAMPGDWVLQAGYVAKSGIKQIRTVSDNAAPFGPGATLANINQRRPLQGHGNNLRTLSDSNSNYHSLQVEGRKRMSRGFSVQGAYTWSKSLDYFSGGTAGVSSTPYPWNARLDYGPSAFHLKHVGSLSWIWEVPSSRRLRVVASGWQVNGLLTARGGFPVNPQTGTDLLRSGTPQQRPDVVGRHALPGDRPKGDRILAWFDRNAFAQPNVGALGTVGRNALVGPGAANLNLGVFRQFPIGERARVQFRSEFFNALNRANLALPNASVSAGARMGQITSADEARVIQFALKLLF
jgi:hypothetical protein